MSGIRVVVLAALLPVWFSANAGTSPVIPSRIATGAGQLTSAGIAPALVVAMIDHGRVAIAGYGKLPDGRVPDADTLYEIGSVTKTFTALLLAEQVQQGKATLDTPVAAWLPGWKIPSRGDKSITLGLLAEQYSGLPKLPGNLGAASGVDPYADYDAARLKAFLAGYTLPHAPGTHYEYSNLGFGLLGYALAKHAGSGYGTLLERDVLRPLGMSDTGIDSTPTSRARWAPGYGATGRPAAHWHWRDALAGAGAMHSDGRDMLTYLKACMGVASTPLTGAIRRALEPRRDIGAMGRIGLAWMTTHTPSGDVVWHNGATGGYSSFIGFSADHQRGVVLLANGYAADLLTRFGFAALSSSLPLPALVELPPVILDSYAGSYTLAPGVVFTVTRHQRRLSVQLTGQPALPAFASARDHFFYTAVDAALDFERDPSGRVVALVLHQNGQSRRAPRTP